MKVVQLCRAVYPFHGYGGIEKYPYYLSKFLITEGIEVEIVASMPAEGRRQEIFQNIKYTFLPPRVQGRRFIGLWQILFNINVARYLRHQEFDILQSYIPPTIYLLLKNRKPVIVQPFGLEPFTLESFLEKKWLKKLYLDLTSRWQWKYSFSHAEAVAAEEDFQIELMVSLGIPREKIIIFPTGVDISYIEQRLKSRQASRESLGLGDADFVLISVNKFIPDKGIDYLVEAFRLVKQRLDNCKLILIGGVKREEEKIYHQKILGMVKEHRLGDSVICLENLPEDLLYDYYSLADVYVSPTLYEDLIMSIQEAMVVGLPVVSTGQGFHVKQGLNGYVVPKRDPQAMAEAILEIWYNAEKRREMGEASREIVSYDDWKGIAKRVIKKYEEISSSCYKGKEWGKEP